MKYRILISEREAKTIIEALERINALTGVFLLPKEKELLDRLKKELKNG